MKIPLKSLPTEEGVRWPTEEMFKFNSTVEERERIIQNLVIDATPDTLVVDVENAPDGQT